MDNSSSRIRKTHNFTMVNLCLSVCVSVLCALTTRGEREREISTDDVQLKIEEKKTKEGVALGPGHLLYASFHFLFRIAFPVAEARGLLYICARIAARCCFCSWPEKASRAVVWSPLFFPLFPSTHPMASSSESTKVSTGQ